MTLFRTFATCAVCAGSLSLAACHTSGSSGGAMTPSAADMVEAFEGLAETVYTPVALGATAVSTGASSATNGALTITRSENAGATVITVDPDGATITESPVAYTFSGTTGLAVGTGTGGAALLVANSDAILDAQTEHGHLTIVAELGAGGTANAGTIPNDTGISGIVTGTPTATGALPTGAAVQYSGDWFAAPEGDFTGGFRNRLTTGTLAMTVDFEDATATGGTGRSITFSNPDNSDGVFGFTSATLEADGIFFAVDFTGSGSLDGVTSSNVEGRFFGPAGEEAIGAGSGGPPSGDNTYLIGFVAHQN